MSTSPTLSRRDFIARSALAATTLALGVRGATAGPAPARWPLITFSKPFQHLDAEATADFVASIGYDGIECPVRPKGQIEPAQADDELPRLAAALRRRGKDVHIVTTDITSMSQAHAEPLLRTIARTGVNRIRLGNWKYDLQRSPAEQLKEIAPALKDIAAACGELGLQAGFQNHSGRNYVGGPLWDLFQLIRDLHPRHMGVCFDIGHATVEGGLSWPVQARLLEPRYSAVFVKDFVWLKVDGSWKAQWCPLGDGLVAPAFFTGLKESTFAGPVSLHHEYKFDGLDRLAADLRRDLAVLRGWLA